MPPRKKSENAAANTIRDETLRVDGVSISNEGDAKSATTDTSFTCRTWQELLFVEKTRALMYRD